MNLLACVRCVRAVAREPSAAYVPGPAGSHQQKCLHCSKVGHPCVVDPLPPALQQAVFAAAASGLPVKPALHV